MPEPTQLRQLVACVSCHRQFDASGHEPGSRFHCSCGEIVEVRPTRPHESAVVRCSACGAPRLHEATSCQFCNSDFTLHEQDLNTICPGCAARISRVARYCHACALPISPQGSAGEPVEATCPACGPDRQLVSRALGGEKLAVLECPKCAGMWLSGPTFQLLEERARERQLSWAPEREEQGPGGHLELSPPNERLYRPCPECAKLMNRRNYGRRSGVIVDVCTEHGVWFDLGELSTILGWIRNGGLAQAQEREALRTQAEARSSSQPYWQGSLAPMSTRSRGLAAMLEKVVGSLLG